MSADITQLSDAELLALAQQHLSQPEQPSLMDNFLPSENRLQDPSAGMSTGALMAAGAGKAVNDLGTGTEQLGADIGNKLGLVSDKTLGNLQQQIDATKVRDQSLMAHPSAELGYGGGELATTLLPTGIFGTVAKVAGMPRTAAIMSAATNPRTYGSAALTGGALGMVQPVASDDWGGGVPFLPPRALNTATGMLGGALGNLVANTLGRVAQPLPIAGSSDKDAASILQAAGVPLDLSQRSGSTFLRRAESALRDNPVTAGAQYAADRERQQAFNDAVLQTAGAQPGSTSATRDVLGPLHDQHDAVYKDVLGRNSMPLNDDLLSTMADVQARADRLGKPAPSNIVKYITELAGDDGVLSGQDIYSVKKDLDSLRNSSDSTEKHLGGQLQEALMDHFTGSLNQADRSALQTVRQQQRNLFTIEPAISKDGLGNISPSMLANQVGVKRNRSASLYGRGSDSFLNLVDLAQSGKQLLPDNLGQAARPSMDLIPLAKGLVLGKPMQWAINRQSPYWAGGLPEQGVGGVIRQALQAPSTSELVGGTLRRLPLNIPVSAFTNSALSPGVPTTSQQ